MIYIFTTRKSIAVLFIKNFLIVADSDNPLTMNLRTYRKATIKKQILDNMAKCTNKTQPNCQGIDSREESKIGGSECATNENIRKRKLSENEGVKNREPFIKVMALDSDRTPAGKVTLNQSLYTKCTKNEKTNSELKLSEEELEKQSEEKRLSNDDNLSSHKRTRNITEDNSENSSMTLQQFTDIVLASEGMSMTKERKKLTSSEQASSATTSTPHRKNSLQSSCGGDDEASNSSPTIVSSILDRKESIESTNKLTFCDNAMIVSSTHPKSRNSGCNGVKLEQFDNGYNNNIVDSTTHNAMVANIMNNKDLTVEVKPINVKPVVLSPRHPNGYNRQFQNNHAATDAKISGRSHNQWHFKSRQNSFQSNGKIHPPHISRGQQRYDSDNSSCSGDMIDSKSSPLPKGRPPSVPKMVEEWLQKMEPPAPEEEDSHFEGNADGQSVNEKSVDSSTPQSVPRKHQLILREPQELKSSPQVPFQTECDSNTVLNLSTKDSAPNSHSNEKHEKLISDDKHNMKGDPGSRDIKSTKNNKPTQVYLRPIPTNQMIEKPTSTLPKSHPSSPNKQQVLALHEPGLKPRRSEYEQIVILGRHPRKEPYPTEHNRRYFNQNNGSGGAVHHSNVDFYSKRLPTSSMNFRNGTTPGNQNLDTHKPRHLVSSPNLEITRISSYPKSSPQESIVQMHPKFERIVRNDFSTHSSTMPNAKSRGQVFMFDSTSHENIKARAMRDIQLAHTKDVHGN